MRSVLLFVLTVMLLGCPPLPLVRRGADREFVRAPVAPRELIRRLTRTSARSIDVPLLAGRIATIDGITARAMGQRWHLVRSGGSRTAPEVSLVVDGDVMYGHVTVDGVSYALRDVGAGRLEVQRIDPARFRRDHPPFQASRRGTPRPLRGPPPPGSTPVHELLVVYTPSAAQMLGGSLAGWVDAAVDDANLSYQDSAVAQRVHLAHLAPVSYVEASDIDDDLSRLQHTNDRVMDEVHALRDRYGADLVVLLRTDHPDWCGVANLAVISSDADDDSAFAVVSVAPGCAVKWTFTHELGHIAGAHHNAGNDPSGPFYAHGHQSPAGGWRTMMAYDCDESCPRIRRFSNPDLTYSDGRALGDGNADNARRLNETALTLEGFRLSGPRVSLYEGNRGTQDHVCVVPADAELGLAFGGSDLRYCDNDEARSLKLFDLPAGRVVRLYDHPSGDTQDDWVEVVTKRQVAEVSIPTFERSYEDLDVRVTYHRNNGLDGKVSRIQISGTASGPRLDLHEGNGGSQNLVCSLPVGARTTVRFPGDGACDNDEARSLTLYDVPAGTVIALYDDPNGSTGDDWTEITVRRAITRRTLASLESNLDDDELLVVHHHDNGLDGKLSRVVVKSAASGAALDLYEGNHASQDLLCSLVGVPGSAYDLTRTGGCGNDEARSARLYDVRANSAILLYDSPSGDRQDDWTAILVRQDLVATTISSFEQQLDRPDLAMMYFRNNGLDGKVSRVEVIRADDFTGVATFHEGNNGSQNKVCDLNLSAQTVRFKSSAACDNDEARSITLTMAKAARTIEIYDSPDCQKSDDWTQIVVKRPLLRRTIGSFQQSLEDADVSVAYHRKNGLDGKVSCVRIY